MEPVPTAVGTLHVERYGRGPTIFGWPSLFCDARTLRPLVTEFAGDHDVVLVDGPGHGRSRGVPGRFSMDACADAAIRVLDAAGVERAIWIGPAWGGHVGVCAALRHPDRVRALVSLNAPLGAWSGRRRALLRASWWAVRLLGPRPLARRIATSQLAPAHVAARPALVDPIVDCIVDSERRGFLRAVRSAMLDRPSLLPRLGAVGVPTLVVTGSEDGLLPVAAARAQAAAIPGARFAVATGTAHQSLWEDPAQVRPLLRAFVDEIEGKEGATERGRGADTASAAGGAGDRPRAT